MMKNLKVYMIVVFVLFLNGFNNLQAAEPFSSKIIRAELDQVNNINKTLVINGKQYQISLDAAVSSFRSEQDQEGLFSVRDLKPGNSYYFELVAKGRDMKNSNFTDVIAVSATSPSE